MFKLFKKKKESGKKYELTKDFKLVNSVPVYRIKALRTFGNVLKGDLGGYVEDESNLSHTGDCWIHDDAIVCNGAIVKDYAQVYNTSVITDKSIVECYATVRHCANISQQSIITHHAEIINNSKVRNSNITDYSYVKGNSNIDNSKLNGNSYIGRDTSVNGSSVSNVSICSGSYIECTITGGLSYSEIDGPSNLLFDNCIIDVVSHNIITSGKFENAKIVSKNDYLSITPLGSENRTLNIYRSKDNGWLVTTGCFLGTIDEFITAVKDNHCDSDGVPNKHYNDYMEAIRNAKLKLNIEENSNDK